MALQYWLRPERGRDDVFGPDIGPFPDFVQLTCAYLRVGPDGEHVGFIGGDEHWGLYPDAIRKALGDRAPANLDEIAEEPWSDIIIYAKEV